MFELVVYTQKGSKLYKKGWKTSIYSRGTKKSMLQILKDPRLQLKGFVRRCSDKVIVANNEEE